jgi:flagellar biosynthesis/type III secretory pathway chaperone
MRALSPPVVFYALGGTRPGHLPHLRPDRHPGAAYLRQQAQHLGDEGRVVVDIGAQQLAHHVVVKIAQILGDRAAASHVEAAAQLGDQADTAMQQLRLAHLVAAFQRCIDALTRLDVERADTCRMLSFGQGGGALTRLYQWCDASGALNSKWLANLTVARQCQQLNDTNGAVVTAKLSRVQQLLMAIRGTSAPPVYSARASRYGALGTRDLGRA